VFVGHHPSFLASGSGYLVVKSEVENCATMTKHLVSLGQKGGYVWTSNSNFAKEDEWGSDDEISS
jgi:hypothetical protein